jgi:hypothetical protein
MFLVGSDNLRNLAGISSAQDGEFAQRTPRRWPFAAGGTTGMAAMAYAHPVVVGVDRTRDALNAVRWAATEAVAGTRTTLNLTRPSDWPKWVAATPTR